MVPFTHAQQPILEVSHEMTTCWHRGWSRSMYNIFVYFLAYKQAHLFGVLRSYLGGGAVISICEPISSPEFLSGLEIVCEPAKSARRMGRRMGHFAGSQIAAPPISSPEFLRLFVSGWSPGQPLTKSWRNSGLEIAAPPPRYSRDTPNKCACSQAIYVHAIFLAK